MLTSKHQIISACKTKYWLVEETTVAYVLFLVMDLACDDSPCIVSTVQGHQNQGAEGDVGGM